MKRSLVSVTLVSCALVLGVVACGTKPPSPSSNPLGGAPNLGGTPDVNKTKGEIGPGGAANTGGAPDVNKTKGTIGPGGAVNTGGAPDVSKSVPPGTKKDGGK